jgi:hypothetical protein
MKAVLAVFCAGLLFVSASSVWAEEDIDNEEPIPASVDEIVSPMDRLAEVKPSRPGFFPWLKVQLKDYPPFLRDTKLDISFRTFYSNRTKYDASINEAWAMGGVLDYRSGWLYDRVRVGSSLYTSQPVYAPDGRDGSGLLATGQKGYTVLGQAYGQIKLMDETYLNLYRYGDYNTPYLSKSDSKMTPYTYEGYSVMGRMGGKDGAPQLNFGGGYILKIKDKTAEKFISMSEKAGANVERGVAALGVSFHQDGFSIAAMNYYCDDVINIGYAETTYTLDITKDMGVRFAFQFTDQRSVGHDLLKGYGFATNQVGVKADLSYKGAVLTLAYTANDDGADLVNPWSGYPGYSGAMITNYSKAGVNAFYTKLSYDFGRVGLPGISGYVAYGRGWGMVDPTTKAALPNEDEYDGNLQYRPKSGYLSGLWLRLRYGVAHQYEGPGQYTHDARISLNYDFQLM